MRLSRSTLPPRRCMSNLPPLFSLVRAGMVTGTMTGIVIGNIESGKSVIDAMANGMMHATTAAGLEVSGTTTINTVGRKTTGTVTMRMTAGEVTIDAKGSSCRVQRT